MTRTPTIASFVVLHVALGGCSSDDPNCWVAYHQASAVCSAVQSDCQLEVETEGDQLACNNETEACRDEVGAELIRCAGRWSCLADWWRCNDTCPQYHCIDSCWNPFYDCADWYATDCEDACGETMGRCINEAVDIGPNDESEEAQAACMQAYHLDCVPACYPEG